MVMLQSKHNYREYFPLHGITITTFFTPKFFNIICRVISTGNIPAILHIYGYICLKKLSNASHVLIMFLSLLPVYVPPSSYAPLQWGFKFPSFSHSLRYICLRHFYIHDYFISMLLLQVVLNIFILNFQFLFFLSLQVSIISINISIANFYYYGARSCVSFLSKTPVGHTSLLFLYIISLSLLKNHSQFVGKFVLCLCLTVAVFITSPILYYNFTSLLCSPHYPFTFFPSYGNFYILLFYDHLILLKTCISILYPYPLVVSQSVTNFNYNMHLSTPFMMTLLEITFSITSIVKFIFSSLF